MTNGGNAAAAAAAVVGRGGQSMAAVAIDCVSSSFTGDSITTAAKDQRSIQGIKQVNETIIQRSSGNLFWLPYPSNLRPSVLANTRTGNNEGLAICINL